MGGECDASLVYGWRINTDKMVELARKDYYMKKRRRIDAGHVQKTDSDEETDNREDERWVDDVGCAPEAIDGFSYVWSKEHGNMEEQWYLSLLPDCRSALPADLKVKKAKITKGRKLAVTLGASDEPPKLLAVPQASE